MSGSDNIIKYFFLSIPLLFHFSVVHAGKAADNEEEMQPKIGSIDDSDKVDSETFEFSAAESKLWLTDHLGNIKQPARLYYEFEKTGSYEDGFVDSVYLDITKFNEDGSKDVTLDFFTAERKQVVAAGNREGVKGNPVLGIYLQGDINEMSRLTQGHWRYFQKLIKLAFARNAVINSTTIEYQGKQLAGERITISPYVNDRRRTAELKQFVNKQYEFILSEAIPGQLYQIKTVIPDKSDSKQPLLQEVLTLKQVEFGSPNQ